MGITKIELNKLIVAILWGIGFFWIALGLRDWVETNVGDGNTTLIIGVIIVAYLIYRYKYKGHYAFG